MQNATIFGSPLSAAHFLFRLVDDKRVPWLARGVVIVALIYAVGPIDLIPDAIPIFGYADDLAFILGALYLARRLTPDDVVAFHPILQGSRDAPLVQEVWVLADDRVGNTNQSLGVAERLGLPHRVQMLRYDQLVRLPNSLRGRSFIGLDRESMGALRDPWPLIVIAAGRRPVAASRYIKMMSAGRTKTVHLGDPDAGHTDFDLIVLPRHDRDRGKARRVVRTTGNANRVTPSRLREHGEAWGDRITGLPRPWVALLVGGDTRSFAFTEPMAQQLGAQASAAAAALGGSLLISTSRRTRAETAEVLLKPIEVPSYVHSWADGSDNPFFAFLALCDYVVVTGDSMSMCTEACTSGKPVYIYAPPEMVSSKYERFRSALFDEGFACPFEGGLSPDWRGRRLNSTDVVASAAADLLAAPQDPTPNTIH